MTGFNWFAVSPEIAGTVAAILDEVHYALMFAG